MCWLYLVARRTFSCYLWTSAIYFLPGYISFTRSFVSLTLIEFCAEPRHPQNDAILNWNGRPDFHYLKVVSKHNSQHNQYGANLCTVFYESFTITLQYDSIWQSLILEVLLIHFSWPDLVLTVRACFVCHLPPMPSSLSYTHFVSPIHYAALKNVRRSRSLLLLKGSGTRTIL